MAEFFTASGLVSLLTLLVLEIVLGIDNVIFIAILTDKLPVSEQDKARKLGIGLAVVTRILLLFSINWVMGLTEALPGLGRFGHNGISGRDLILLVGGAFLIGKSTYEIHEKLEAAEHGEGAGGKAKSTFTAVIIQIILVDLVFSLDSVITAVGISGHLPIMIVAVVLAAGVMLFFSGSVARFVKKHPTMKILALAFLILIGTLLVIEGWDEELAHQLHLKNYIYFAMAFSFLVELVNMNFRKASNPVELHRQMPASSSD